MCKKFLIFDLNNLIYKSYFGMPALTTSYGLPVNAVYGSLKTIKSVIDKVKPYHVCGVWDSGGKNFRHELDPNYKGHRPPTDDALKIQFALLKEALSVLGIPQMTAPDGIEGDDLSSTLAVKATTIGMEGIIASADRDFYQLCENPLIKIYSYTLAKSDPENVLVDAEYVRKKYELEPRQLVDQKSLMGEKSDNIQSLKGIGMKTSQKLIAQHGTMQELFRYLEANPKDKYHHLVQEKHIAELGYKLALINTDVELPNVKILPVHKIKIDENALREYFVKLEMNSFLKAEFPYWSKLFNYAVAV